MKIIEGNFNKQENKHKTLQSKITEALNRIFEVHSLEAEGNFVLLTEVDKEIYISSDLSAEDFNFLLDTAKLNVLYSAVIPQD
jgi:hypothetical protein